MSSNTAHHPKYTPGYIRGILAIYLKYTANIPRATLGIFTVDSRFWLEYTPNIPGSWVYSQYIWGIFGLDIHYYRF